MFRTCETHDLFCFFLETLLRNGYFMYSFLSSKLETHALYPFQHGPIKSRVSFRGLAPRDSLNSVGFESKTMKKALIIRDLVTWIR